MLVRWKISGTLAVKQSPISSQVNFSEASGTCALIRTLLKLKSGKNYTSPFWYYVFSRKNIQSKKCRKFSKFRVLCTTIFFEKFTKISRNFFSFSKLEKIIFAPKIVQNHYNNQKLAKFSLKTPKIPLTSTKQTPNLGYNTSGPHFLISTVLSLPFQPKPSTTTVQLVFALL